MSRLRKARGKTPSDVTDVCGLSEATMSQIESGQTGISAHHLFVLARAVGDEIADVFADDANPMNSGGRSLTRRGGAFPYVPEGTVALHADLNVPPVFNAGDNVYSEGAMKHAYLKSDERPATILAVVGPSRGPTT